MNAVTFTWPEVLLSVNVVCVALLGCRCWWLERKLAALQTPAEERPTVPDLDAKRTAVWHGRKPTVFHRRRA